MGDIFDYLEDMESDLTWYQKLLLRIVAWFSDLRNWRHSHYISRRVVYGLDITYENGEHFESVLFTSYRQMKRFWRMNEQVYRDAGLRIQGGGGVPVYRKAFQMEYTFTDSPDNTRVLTRADWRD